MSLRDETYDTMNRVWEGRQAPEFATDELVALMREAMTSDEAVRAAVALTQTPDIEHDAEVMGVTEDDIRGEEWKRAKDAITAALDAALGEEH